MKHIVVDNIIPKPLQHKYELDYKKFKWEYQRSTYEEKIGTLNSNEVYDTGQLVFPVNTMGYHDPYESNLDPLLDAIKLHIRPVKKIKRIKFNLLWRVTEAGTRWNIPHHDTEDIINEFNNKWSAVYYVNSADGDTCLFYPDHVERIKPKRGRVLIFPANIRHASSNPVVSQERVVINFVLETENEMRNM